MTTPPMDTPGHLRFRLSEASSARVLCSAHVLSFQPKAAIPNEDRYFIEDWTLPNGQWKLLAIFDGKISWPHLFAES